MLRLFNSLGKKLEDFQPVNERVVNIFTCGPSIYQRAHIGNFRTFLFEDILVRYLDIPGLAGAAGDELHRHRRQGDQRGPKERGHRKGTHG